MQISIVIPIYNALALAKQCVRSIYEHSSTHSFEVIAVDNGSAPDVEEWLALTASQHTNFRFLRYPEPLGFARSVNVGAAEAAGEVLIIQNSDTLVTRGWMEGLYEALLADPSLGAITPTTNHAGEPAQMDFSTIDLPAAKALAKVAKRVTPRNIVYLPQRLTFFCVALRRSVWLEFNGLDEAYKVGNFEDDDLCLRLRVAGYRLGLAQHVFLYHHNNATFSANKISHGGWMSKNAATFADHARALSESHEARTALKWPRRSAIDISVVILPGLGDLARTLQSLNNQTVIDFEIILPGTTQAPTRSWVAYLAQGDIFYPIHLEALFDAMERNGAESIFADGWIKDATEAAPHPDAARQIRKTPLMLAGWMHHTSLDPGMLFEDSMPMHWPRLTWEMQSAPNLAAYPPPPGAKEKRSLTDTGRQVYRKLVPLETRLRLDRGVRRIIRRPLPIPEQVQMQKLAAHLDTQRTAGADAGKFALDATLPAVFMLNGVAWNTVTQRQHHFARGLADLGRPVFWIEPTLTPARNWYTVRPLQQVAPGVYIVRLPGITRDIYSMEWTDATVDAMAAAIRQIAAIYGIGSETATAISLVNYPRWQPLAAALRERCGWTLVNDCLDDHRAMAGVYQTVHGSFEDKLEKGADLLITSSVIQQQRMLPRPSHLLHNAADFDLFSSAISAGHLQHLPKPIVGFFGALADWLDMDLIHAAALEFPDWSFVYIGPYTFSHTAVEVVWLRNTHLPNIIQLPQMDQRTLAAHLADFAVCTMPFQDIPVTRSMNPVKLYEYLAAGKPAVSRDLPEVRHLVEGGAGDLIALYTTPKEFFDRLHEALDHDSPELQQRRKDFARAHDWSERVETLSALLTGLKAVELSS